MTEALTGGGYVAASVTGGGVGAQQVGDGSSSGVIANSTAGAGAAATTVGLGGIPFTSRAVIDRGRGPLWACWCAWLFMVTLLYHLKC